MDIRRFDAADTESIVDLWRQCGLVVPWNDPYKDIARKLKVDADLFLVGELGGAVVATVMAGYDGHRGWINYLAVSPSHQGKGFGRALVERIESLLAARGCPKINLQIRETNEHVAAFYQALGYRRDRCISLGKRLERDD
ncbi:MAG: GNAT family acetyltransferase [Arenicellales bacterium]